MNKNNKLVTVLTWLIYASTFIPLVVFSQYLSPFHFGKTILFRSLVEVMAVLYLFIVVRDRRYLPPKTWLFIVTSLFFGVYGLTALTGIDLGFSTWGSLERMGGFYSFIHFWIYFVILTGILRTREAWLKLINVSIVAALLSALYGFLQKTDTSWVIGSGGRNKIFGTIGNPALFAGYILVNAFWALMLFARQQISSNQRWYYGISFFLLALAVVLAGVRGSVLGLFLGFSGFALGYAFVLGNRSLRRGVVGLIITAIAFVGILVTFKNTDFIKSNTYLSRYSDFSLQSYTVQTRSWTWRSGFEGWKETPKTILLGYGPENFNIPFSNHFNPKHFVGLGSETLFDRAHNMFLEVLVTMGLLGFVVYVAWFVLQFAGLFQVFRRGRAELSQPAVRQEAKDKVILALGLASGLVAYLVHNFFIFDTTANYIAFFIGLGLLQALVYESAYSQASTEAKPLFKAQAVGYILPAIALVTTIFSIYCFNIRPAQANYTTTRAIILGWNKQYDAAILGFKAALAYDLPMNYEIANRYAQFLVERGSGATVPGLIAEAIKGNLEYQKAAAQKHPADYVPLLYTSRLNIILGKDDPKSPHNDEAIQAALAALKIAPSFVRAYFEVGQAYLNKKDYDSALPYFRKALELNPQAAVSNWYLGSILIEMGRVDEGTKYTQLALQYHFVPTEVDYLRLANIFIKRNDFINLAIVYEGLIKIIPNSPQYHASLAATYAKIGKIDQAVEQARIAARLDPKFEPEARAFLKSLGREF